MSRDAVLGEQCWGWIANFDPSLCGSPRGAAGGPLRVWDAGLGWTSGLIHQGWPYVKAEIFNFGFFKMFLRDGIGLEKNHSGGCF